MRMLDHWPTKDLRDPFNRRMFLLFIAHVLALTLLVLCVRENVVPAAERIRQFDGPSFLLGIMVGMGFLLQLFAVHKIGDM